jgi:hypothetical protein
MSVLCTSQPEGTDAVWRLVLLELGGAAYTAEVELMAGVCASGQSWRNFGVQGNMASEAFKL